MPKFRKKPVVIEAEQWFPDKPVDGVVFPIPGEYLDGLRGVGEKFDLERTGIVRTLEGPFVCWPGDWIIKGVEGEKYPCKPSIFEASYEKVDSQ